MRWQNGIWPAEDAAQAWAARGHDMAWIEAAVVAWQIRAAAQEA